MPMITHLAETALCADDLERMVAFYRDVLGLRVLSWSGQTVRVPAREGAWKLHRTHWCTQREARFTLMTPKGRATPP